MATPGINLKDGIQVLHDALTLRRQRRVRYLEDKANALARLALTEASPPPAPRVIDHDAGTAEEQALSTNAPPPLPPLPREVDHEAGTAEQQALNTSAPPPLPPLPRERDAPPAASAAQPQASRPDPHSFLSAQERDELLHYSEKSKQLETNIARENMDHAARIIIRDGWQPDKDGHMTRTIHLGLNNNLGDRQVFDAIQQITATYLLAKKNGGSIEFPHAPPAAYAHGEPYPATAQERVLAKDVCDDLITLDISPHDDHFGSVTFTLPKEYSMPDGTVVPFDFVEFQKEVSSNWPQRTLPVAKPVQR